MTPGRRLLPVLLALTAALLTACGSEEIELRAEDRGNLQIERGAEIFNDVCAACHTLEAAGAQGSAYSVGDQERVDGPNFNARNEQVDAILYAIRNGGFSGAIMPENLVTGEEAEAVAQFLAKYSGTDAVQPVTPNSGTAAR